MKPENWKEDFMDMLAAIPEKTPDKECFEKIAAFIENLLQLQAEGIGGMVKGVREKYLAAQHRGEKQHDVRFAIEMQNGVFACDDILALLPREHETTYLPREEDRKA